MSFYHHFLRLVLILPFALSVAAPASAQMQDAAPFPATMDFTEHDLDGQFDTVAQFLNSESYPEASAALQELKDIATASGLSNLPQYSWKLIERAELLLGSDKNTQAAFLVRWAVTLSEEDARIRLTASSFGDVVGEDAALTYLSEGLQILPSQPSTAVPAMLNVLLVLLVGFTLAFFLTCLVQVIVNSSALLKRSGRRIPVRVRGLVGPFVLLLLLGAPLFAGILVVIGCWALLLSRCVESCKWLGVSAGALVLAWWFCIPVLQTAGLQVSEPINKALENTRTDSYQAFDSTMISEHLKTGVRDPLAAFALGDLYLRRKNYSAAEQIFKQLTQLGSFERSDVYKQAALVNLGVISYHNGDLEGALDRFKRAESAGATHYELFHNVALIMLAQVDTLGHREYYDKAQAVADGRDMSADEAAVLSVTLPLNEYYLRYLQPVSTVTPQQVEQQEAAVQVLFASLMAFGSPLVMFVWAMVLIAAGIMNMRAVGASRYLLVKGAGNPSLIWAFVPGGYFGAGRYPGTCVLVLGLFMSLVMLAVGEPHIHYEIIAGELPLHDILLFFAVGLLLVQAGLSLLVSSVSSRRTVSDFLPKGAS